MPPKNRILSDASKPESPKPVPSPIVRVRARSHLAETIDGQIQRFAPGEVFSIPASRAAALGPLVERIDGPVDPRA